MLRTVRKTSRRRDASVSGVNAWLFSSSSMVLLYRLQNFLLLFRIQMTLWLIVIVIILNDKKKDSTTRQRIFTVDNRPIVDLRNWRKPANSVAEKNGLVQISTTNVKCCTLEEFGYEKPLFSKFESADLHCWWAKSYSRSKSVLLWGQRRYLWC